MPGVRGELGKGASHGFCQNAATLPIFYQMVNYREGPNAQNSGTPTLRLFTTRRLAYNASSALMGKTNLRTA
jgi:hypothetical protein